MMAVGSGLVWGNVRGSSSADSVLDDEIKVAALRRFVLWTMWMIPGE
jgi:hypothetical protein